MHQGWEKRFLLIDASERTASSPCKKPLFARIRRRVGRITAVGEIAAKHLPQRNHAQRGQHGTEEKGVPVVPRQLIEHPAEKRSENDVADRQQHREGRVELSEEFAGKELLPERRRKEKRLCLFTDLLKSILTAATNYYIYKYSAFSVLSSVFPFHICAVFYNRQLISKQIFDNCFLFLV